MAAVLSTQDEQPCNTGFSVSAGILLFLHKTLTKFHGSWQMQPQHTHHGWIWPDVRITPLAASNSSCTNATSGSSIPQPLSELGF